MSTPNRRRTTTTNTNNGPPQLFEYFAVVGLRQIDFNLDKNVKIKPNQKEMPFRPELLYTYNAQAVYNAHVAATAATQTSSDEQSSEHMDFLKTASITPSKSQSPPQRMDRSPSEMRQDMEKQRSQYLSKEEMESESEVLMQIRKFCFPDLSDIINRWVALAEKYKCIHRHYRMSFKYPMQSEKFTFVLTKTGAQRLYGHCRRVFSIDSSGKIGEVPTALCLVSKHPFLNLFDQLMDHALARWLVCPEAIFPLLDAVVTHPTPGLGDVFHVRVPSQYPNMSDEVVTLWLNDTYHVSLKPLFRALSVDNIMFITSCVLTERRLIFSSNSLELLSDCVHGLMSTIYPFRWQHIFIPVLPEQLLNYLGAPMPFVIGIKKHLATEMTDYPPSDYILVDLDENIIQSSMGLDVLKPLPNEPAWKLRRELNRLLKKSSLLLETSQDFQAAEKQKKKHKTKKSLFQDMTDVAKGWDNMAFFDAFLAFFTLFIGDWKQFYQDSQPNVPVPPFHLATEETQNTLKKDIIRSVHPLGAALAANAEPDFDTPHNPPPLSNNPLFSEDQAVAPTRPRQSHLQSEFSSSSIADIPQQNSFSNLSVNDGDDVEAQANASSSSLKSDGKGKRGKQFKGVLKKAGGAALVKLRAAAAAKNPTAKTPRGSAVESSPQGGIASNVLNSGAAHRVRQKRKERAQKKQAKIENLVTYDVEALKYIELLCQSQLFQTWFVRQQKDTLDPFTKVSGIQDRYDYAMRNRANFGASYTRTFKHLRGTTISRQNVMNLTIDLKGYVEDISTITSNKGHDMDATIKKGLIRKIGGGAYDPRVFSAVNNILEYRLRDSVGKNYPHAVMALGALRVFVHESSDRYLVVVSNEFLPHIDALRHYKHAQEPVQKLVRALATKVYSLATDLNQMRKPRIGKYVSFRDIYEYKYYETDHSEMQKKSDLIDAKMGKIDFGKLDLETMDADDQSFIVDLLGIHAPVEQESHTSAFGEISQFVAANPNAYRIKMMSGEVKMIPPFDHLHFQFAPPPQCQKLPPDQQLLAPEKLQTPPPISAQPNFNRFTSIQTQMNSSQKKSRKAKPIITLATRNLTTDARDDDDDEDQSGSETDNFPPQESSAGNFSILTRDTHDRESSQVTMREMKEQWANFDSDLEDTTAGNAFEDPFFQHTPDPSNVAPVAAAPPIFGGGSRGSNPIGSDIAAAVAAETVETVDMGSPTRGRGLGVHHINSDEDINFSLDTSNRNPTTDALPAASLPSNAVTGRRRSSKKRGSILKSLFGNAVDSNTNNATNTKVPPMGGHTRIEPSDSKPAQHQKGFGRRGSTTLWKDPNLSEQGTDEWIDFEAVEAAISAEPPSEDDLDPEKPKKKKRRFSRTKKNKNKVNPDLADTKRRGSNRNIFNQQPFDDGDQSLRRKSVTASTTAPLTTSTLASTLANSNSSVATATIHTNTNTAPRISMRAEHEDFFSSLVGGFSPAPGPVSQQPPTVTTKSKPMSQQQQFPVQQRAHRNSVNANDANNNANNNGNNSGNTPSTPQFPVQFDTVMEPEKKDVKDLLKSGVYSQNNAGYSDPFADLFS